MRPCKIPRTIRPFSLSWPWNAFCDFTGPQPSWDPDVVAALDEDFDYDNPDNLLEDDFVLKASEEMER